MEERVYFLGTVSDIGLIELGVGLFGVVELGVGLFVVMDVGGVLFVVMEVGVGLLGVMGVEVGLFELKVDFGVIGLFELAVGLFGVKVKFSDGIVTGNSGIVGQVLTHCKVGTIFGVAKEGIDWFVLYKNIADAIKTNTAATWLTYL